MPEDMAHIDPKVDIEKTEREGGHRIQKDFL